MAADQICTVGIRTPKGSSVKAFDVYIRRKNSTQTIRVYYAGSRRSSLAHSRNCALSC